MIMNMMNMLHDNDGDDNHCDDNNDDDHDDEEEEGEVEEEEDEDYDTGDFKRQRKAARGCSYDLTRKRYSKIMINKQTSKQTIKQSNKQTNKQTRREQWTLAHLDPRLLPNPSVSTDACTEHGNSARKCELLKQSKDHIKYLHPPF